MLKNITVLSFFIIASLTCNPVFAQDGVYTVTTQEQSFSDTSTAIENAIINRGLSVDYHGFIGDMLKRTAEDVGSSKVLYKDAEFFMFCSAVMSRDVMEADIKDIAYCPYVVFVYEEDATPGTVTIGFRQLPSGGARDKINSLLKGIADDAVDGF